MLGANVSLLAVPFLSTHQRQATERVPNQVFDFLLYFSTVIWCSFNSTSLDGVEGSLGFGAKNQGYTILAFAVNKCVSTWKSI